MTGKSGVSSVASLIGALPLRWSVRCQTVADWIAQLVVKRSVVEKVHQKHDLTIDEVEEAVAFGHHDAARWDNHPDYGRRLIVRGTTAAGRRVIAYLAPYDDGVWEVRTAWPE